MEVVVIFLLAMPVWSEVRKVVLLASVAFVATPSIIADSSQGWWWPDRERYNVGYTEDTTSTNVVTVRGTSEYDLEDLGRVAFLFRSFPPYTFDTRTSYVPGSGGPYQGYYVLVDGIDLVVVVAEDRAKELSRARATAYVLIARLVEMWSKLVGQEGVTVSLAYVPAFREPVVFAIGSMATFGVRVAMGE